MKKIVALLLCLVLAFGVSTSVATAEAPKKFTIGFPWATASTDPVWISITNNVRAAVEAAGGELITVETDLSAEYTARGGVLPVHPGALRYFKEAGLD